MNRVLLIIGGLLVGLLAALFTVPALVDWTRYRGVFEEEATRLLGRDVRVGGRVNMRLLPSPYIQFEKVRIADTQATVGEPLFRADDFTIWLAIGPLFSGTLQASEIELRKPFVTLVVDEQGSGNWSSLSTTETKSRLAPGTVTLDYVRITNGTIAVFNVGGEERTRLEHINGELSAAAIEGPYRVAAAYSHGGASREIRLATAKPDADGATRFKGTVRAPQTGASYTLDGQLLDVFKQLRVSGELTAKLPLPQIVAAGDTRRPAGEASYDLKAAFAADTRSATVSDVTLSFEQDNRPQLATGQMQIDWRSDVKATVELASHWIDLDRIGGREPDTPLPALLQRFAAGIESAIPAGAETAVRLVLDQATLGGEVVSGLNIAIQRKGGVLTVEIAAALPGASRLYANGILQPANPNQIFDGNVSVRGASVQRVSGWALRNTAWAGAQQDGPFLLSGRLALGTERMAGRDLAIEFAGNNVSGGASYVFGAGGHQITLDLEGSALDLGPVFDQGGPAAFLQSLALRLAGAARPESSKTAPAASEPPSIVARLRIGRVLAGKTVLDDVVADVTWVNGNLAIPRLKAGATGRWTLEVNGDLASLTKPNARGSVAFLATAETADGLKSLLGLADPGEAWLPSPQRATAALPLRLAGRLRLGETAPGVCEITFDGVLGKTAAAGSVRLEPRPEGWREWRADAALTLNGREIGGLLDLVAGDQLGGLAAAGGSAPASATLRAVGTAKGGLTSLVTFDAAGLATEFRGRLGVSDTAALTVDGTIRLNANDAAQVMAHLGARERTALVGQPVAGVLAVAAEGGKLRLESNRLNVGNAILSGRIERQATAAEGQRLTGHIAVAALSLPQALSLLTVGRPATRDGARAALQPSAWAEEPFDVASLAGMTASLRIDTGDLQLAPGLSLGKASVQADVDAGRLELRLAEASALGGKATGTLKLERAPAGVKAIVETSLAGGRLESRAAQRQSPFATGAIAWKATLEGQALSPRGLAAALQGKGEIALGKTVLSRLSPNAVQAVAGESLATKIETTPVELRRRIEVALAAVPVELPARTLPFEVADGIVRVMPVVVEKAGDKLTGVTLIDIEALRFDSEWRIDPAQPAGGGRPAAEARPGDVRPTDGGGVTALPGIAIVYAGPLADLGTIEPRLQYETLERVLSVRRMERELDELERQRRNDEERARQEGERQRQLEVERQRLVEQQRAAAARDPAAPPDTSVPPMNGPGSPPAQPNAQPANPPTGQQRPAGFGATTIEPVPDIRQPRSDAGSAPAAQSPPPAATAGEPPAAPVKAGLAPDPAAKARPQRPPTSPSRRYPFDEQSRSSP